MSEIVESIEAIARRIVREELEGLKPADKPLKPYLKPHEVARLLGVSERTVVRRCLSGELAAVRFGRAWRIRPEDLKP